MSKTLYSTAMKLVASGDLQSNGQYGNAFRILASRKAVKALAAWPEVTAESLRVNTGGMMVIAGLETALGDDGLAFRTALNNAYRNRPRQV